MLTAKAERAMKIEGLECGADDYLVKPFDAVELRARVRSLLKLRRLHQALDERNQELETTLKELQATQARLLETAHRAGMTEIATGVLHNVGNVLNSVNISVTTVGNQLQKLRLTGPAKAGALLTEYASGLDRFLTSDPRGRKLPEYLTGLSASLQAEQQQMLTELEFLKEKLQVIKNIISSQQKYAKQVAFRELVELPVLMDDVLGMHMASMARHGVDLVRDFEGLPVANLEKLKLVQVLDNLVRNAVESMKTHAAPRHVLTVRLQRAAADRVRVDVSDTGRGIAPENLHKIFNYGFTTKQSGNGFGLHSAANAMTEMGGTISVRSDGVGRGATFTIEFPFATEAGEPQTLEHKEVACA
jgi:signal transduction histidine kinase